MKTKIIAFAGSFTLAALAQGGTLALDIISSNRVVSPNSVETYSGTIENHIGSPFQTADLVLDFSGFDFSLVNFIQILGMPDLTVPDGSTSPVLGLFTFELGSATPGIYQADVLVETISGQTSDVVTVSETVVPEPGPWVLLAGGLLLMIVFRNGRAIRGVLHVAPLLLMAVLFALHSTPVWGQASPVVLATGLPGISLENTNTLLGAVRVRNLGTAPAQNVTAQSVSLAGGTLAAPSLPLNLGTIPNGESAVLQLRFAGSFAAGVRYIATIRGTYGVGTANYGFQLSQILTVPPPAPGSNLVQTAFAAPNLVSGAPFPLQPPNQDEANETPAPPVPLGTLIPGPPAVDGTGVQSFSQFLGIRPAAVAQPLAAALTANLSVGLTPAFSTGDSSGAAGGGVVFATGNWYAGYSTNGGASFNSIAITSVFPNNVDGGFCCDQIVHYVPSINRFIWLMMFSNQTDAKGNRLSGNRLRIASASPADIINSGGTAWTYWDLTTGLFGLGTNQLDYPDMSIGTNFLYVSADNRFGTGLIVMRIPLAQIRDSVTINIDYTNPADSAVAFGGHVMQNTVDEIFWAGHNSNHNMRVFSLAEGSNTYFWRDVEIPPWPNSNTISATAPDGQDFLNFLGTSFPGSAILGAARALSPLGPPFQPSDDLWFAWTAPSGNGFPQAHVRIVVLDHLNNFHVKGNHQLWNSTFAFAYPALASDPNQQIGMSLVYGGGGVTGTYENHVVGYWGDFLVYVTTNSNAGTTRYGDYVSIRRDGTDPSTFVAFGYGLTATTDQHYVRFSRPQQPPPR